MTGLQTVSTSAWDNPPAIAARGTLIVVPGRGEHPGLYERFGTRLAFDGYKVRAVTDPTVAESETTLQIQQLLLDPELPHPQVLVGSDGGALFAVAVVAGRRVSVDALILAGLPQPGPVDGERTETWEAEISERTACPTHQARLRADELVRHGALNHELPGEWFAAAVLSDVRVPVLGLHGAADTVSRLNSVRKQYEANPTAQLVSIVDGRHDALNDATHRTAAATIVLFLERLRLGSDLPVIAREESTSEPS